MHIPTLIKSPNSADPEVQGNKRKRNDHGRDGKDGRDGDTDMVDAKPEEPAEDPLRNAATLYVGNLSVCPLIYAFIYFSSPLRSASQQAPILESWTWRRGESSSALIQCHPENRDAN